MTRPRTLVGAMEEQLALRHASPRTVEAYVGWARRYIRFHARRHPREMGAREVAAFLDDLAARWRVSASTHNQARAALVFLYEQVLDAPRGWLNDVAVARVPTRLPVVLTRSEVQRVLALLPAPVRTISLLLYGSGLRLMEACRLRIKDLDLERCELLVRQGKGGRDRVTVLPERLVPAMREQIVVVQSIHRRDRMRGGGYVALPDSVGRDAPYVRRQFRWQWLFPATRRYRDRWSGEVRRHHLHETVVQRAVSAAGRASGIGKRVNAHALRHSFAVHMLESGYDIRTVQELLGHRSVATTMIYTRLVDRVGRGVLSPADALQDEATSDVVRAVDGAGGARAAGMHADADALATQAIRLTGPDSLTAKQARARIARNERRHK